MKTRLVTAVLFLFAIFSASAQPHPQDKGYNYVRNVSYVSADEQDAYRKERCVLDIYYPETDKGFATLVWFHGGGLNSGNKELLDGFRRQGFAVVSVNYRLSPKAECPAYLDDAAMAVAWTFDNICFGPFCRRISYPDGRSCKGIRKEIWTRCRQDSQALSGKRPDRDPLTDP